MAKNALKLFAETGAKFKFNEEVETFFVSPYYASSYNFPYNPDTLCKNNDYSIYDEMRHDDQIKQVLHLKKSMLFGNGWSIVCEDEEIKDFISDNLKSLNDRNFEQTFEEILWDISSFYDYGFSIAEPIYRLEGGKYEIETIKVRPPHSFFFEIDDFGNVIKVVQAGARKEIELSPDQLLHFAYQMEWGNPYGTSDLKSAYTAWKIKKFFIKMYAMYGERFLTPIVHGKVDDNANTEDIDKFYTILKKFQNNTVLVTPKSSEVELIHSGNDSSELYKNAISNFNLWIARSILLPDLFGLSGDQISGGSYSLGRQQFEIFFNLIKKDREFLEKKITQKILKPLVMANWGDKVEVKFEFLPYGESDEVELTKIWLDAVKGKAFKPNEEEINHFREVVKYPQGEVVEAKQEPSPFGGFSKDKKDYSKYYFRELTAYEKKVDFANVKSILDKNDKSIKTKALKVSDKMIGDLTRQVSDKKILANWKPEKVNNLQIKYKNEMNFVFRSNFKDLFSNAINAAQKEIFPQGDKKYVDSEILPDEFLKIIEQESFKAVGDYSDDLLKRGRNIVMNGLKKGLSQNTIVKQLREDLTAFSENWIKTVVRTKSNEVYNSARKIYWETDKLASQIVEAYQYSAILDERTSEVCRRLDGKVFKKGEYIDRITPPLHFNCRSMLVPVTKFEDYSVSKSIPIDKLKEIGGGLI